MTGRGRKPLGRLWIRLGDAGVSSAERHVTIPQVGGVVIHSDVEIGSEPGSIEAECAIP
jgi:hypothetical protein